jgi:GH43 family beta-xylosidase
MSVDRRQVLGGLAAIAAAPALARTEARTPVLRNPLVRQRADAQVFRHTDGLYYMTASVPEYDRVVLRRAPTLAGLATAREVVLWRHLASGPLSGFIWAPELHLIDGRWIMYFAAGPSGGGEDVFRIRTHALVCDGKDPMTGRWSVLGQLQTPWDSFNLDSTVFVHRGVRYLAWAQREPGIDTNSNVYIAPLATPLTLGARPARLTVPTLPWEIRGFKVAEAPALLARNGRLFMTYSASATDDRYCMGLLTARDDADIMDPAAWTKSPVPVFVSDPDAGVWGPGHNSFTVDERGRDMLVYHARDYRAIKGDPLFDPNRHTRVQPFGFRADGTPDFGKPVRIGALPARPLR